LPLAKESYKKKIREKQEAEGWGYSGAFVQYRKRASLKRRGRKHVSKNIRKGLPGKENDGRNGEVGELREAVETIRRRAPVIRKMKLKKRVGQ